MAALSPIGILGGTFDPVHHGHLRPALELLEQLPLGELRLVPCRVPPHRNQPQATAEQRAAMLELAIAGQAGFILDRRELQRDGPSYMVDTLDSLRQEFPTHPLCLILGQDAFASLHHWHRWQSLSELAHLVVLQRPGYTPTWPTPVAALLRQRQLQHPKQLRQQPAGGVLVQPCSQLEISATGIRQQLAAGYSARYLLPHLVMDFIANHRLYGYHTA